MDPRPAPRWPKKLLVGLTIASTMVGIAEIGCRLALGPEPISDESPLYASAETIGFRIAENLRYGDVNTNSLGFRGPEPDAAGPERYLVLGDSMTFGAEVKDDETFCARLQAKLGSGRQVINAGCPGYGPWEEGIQLAAVGARVKPTRVLVMFFAGNDFQDAGREEMAYRVIGGRLVSQRQYQETGPPMRIVKNILANVWSWGLVRAVRQVSSRSKPGSLTFDGGPVGMDSPQIRCILELDDYGRAAERNEPLVARGWHRMEAHFTKLRETCAGLNADLTVAILPLPIVFDRELRLRLANRWKVEPASIDAERPGRTLSGLLRKLGVRCIDLAPDLRAHPQQAKLHLPSDLHLSVAGHAVVADALAARL